MDEFISHHLTRFCFQLPAHILCLNLQSRPQVWLVHCGHFLYACYLWYFHLTLAKLSERTKKLQCNEISLRQLSRTKGSGLKDRVSFFQGCLRPIFTYMYIERVIGCCPSLILVLAWLFECILAQNEDSGFFPVTYISKYFRKGQEEERLWRPIT